MSPDSHATKSDTSSGATSVLQLLRISTVSRLFPVPLSVRLFSTLHCAARRSVPPIRRPRLRRSLVARWNFSLLSPLFPHRQKKLAPKRTAPHRRLRTTTPRCSPCFPLSRSVFFSYLYPGTFRRVLISSSVETLVSFLWSDLPRFFRFFCRERRREKRRQIHYRNCAEIEKLHSTRPTVEYDSNRVIMHCWKPVLRGMWNACFGRDMRGGAGGIREFINTALIRCKLRMYMLFSQFQYR